MIGFIVLLLLAGCSEDTPSDLPKVEGGGRAEDVAELMSRIPALIGDDWCLARIPTSVGSTAAEKQAAVAVAKAQLPQRIAQLWASDQVLVQVANSAQRLDNIANGLALRLGTCTFRVFDWMGIHVDGETAVANVHGGVQLCDLLDDTALASPMTKPNGCWDPPTNHWYHATLLREADGWNLENVDYYCRPCG
jgi:hypothetical protein